MQEREVALASGETAPPHQGKLRALILTPTRELALQVSLCVCVLSVCVHMNVHKPLQQNAQRVRASSCYFHDLNCTHTLAGVLPPDSCGQSEPDPCGSHCGRLSTREAGACAACTASSGGSYAWKVCVCLKNQDTSYYACIYASQAKSQLSSRLSLEAFAPNLLNIKLLTCMPVFFIQVVGADERWAQAPHRPG